MHNNTKYYNFRQHCVIVKLAAKLSGVKTILTVMEESS